MQQYWLVENKVEETGKRYLYLCNANGREDAKKKAHPFLVGDRDRYIVTPLTDPGDIVQFRIGIDT